MIRRLRELLHAGAALGMALSVASTGLAGEFTRLVPEGEYFDHGSSGPCAARFDGQILNGDSIGGGMNGSDFAPLCLSSPGGSLPAGLALETDAQWGARILPGETCESACALAFLSAGYETGNGLPAFYLERAIWAGGRLGLHSPGLQLPPGAQVDTSTVETAFKAALSATSQVYRRHQSPDGAGRLPLNSYLYQRFLETPPDDMYYIDTVGDALMAELTVLGVDRSARLTPELIDTVCRNALITTGRFEVSLTNKGRKPNRNAAELLTAYHGAETQFEDVGPSSRQFRLFMDAEGDTIGYGGLYPSGDYRYFMQCFVHFPKRNVTGDVVRDLEEVSVAWDQGYEPIRTITQVREAWEGLSRYGDHERLDSLALFAFDAPLASLPKDAEYRRHFGGSETPLRVSDAPQTGFAAPPQSFVQLIGRDVTGRDFSTGNADNAETCRVQCDSVEACAAATFDRWNNKCYLKVLDGSSRQRVMAKATSYVRQSLMASIPAPHGRVEMLKRNDKSFPATPDDTLRVDTYDTCAAACRQSSWCIGLNWRRAQKSCEMFARPPEYFTEKGVDIGYLQQAD